VSVESLPADKLIGQVLANRYQILHRLGEGAMGAVYKARHVKVGRAFAVKVLHARLLQDPKIALRFDREAELAGRLRHPNVIGVVDVGEIDGMRYMVMDYAEGPDLARLLVEAPMPADRIIRLVRQMLEGLYHAHEQGLIHRDFKPENVIIERDSHGTETPRIVDFGIAILRDGGETIDGQGRLTTNGLVLGTPHYMAPEQAVADPIDHRIDLFAMGIVIYEMLCGRLPFDGNGAEVARANLMLDPPPIVERVPYLAVDPLLEAFARRLMEKKRSARPATAKAARELLDLIDRDRPAAAAALGLPVSAYTPAVTLPVPVQERLSAYAEPPTPEPTWSKATPTPIAPAPAPVKPAPPAGSGAAPVAPRAAPVPPPVSATAPTVVAPALVTPASSAQPGQPPPRLDRPASRPSPRLPSFPPSDPAFIAPDAPRTSPARGDHETAIQTPLAWPPSSNPKRRRQVLIAGILFGAACILATLLFARRATHDTPAANDQVAVAPVGSGTTTAGPAPEAATPEGTKTTEPKAFDLDAINPKTTVPSPTTSKATEGPATDPRASSITPPDPAATKPRTANHAATDPTDGKATAANTSPKRSPTHDARSHESKVVDTKAHSANSDETASETKVAAQTSPNTGTTPTDLHNLYYSLPKYLNELPRDKSEELWTRWRLISIEAKKLAPQAERDQAAEQLTQILKDARAALKASGKSAPP
jgi:serine/threonine protein kinase